MIDEATKKSKQMVNQAQQEVLLQSKITEKLKNESSFEGIYHFHAGMINDYFDRKQQAQQHFKQLIEEETMEISLRSLQIISNFYLRNGQKDKALQIAYTSHCGLTVMHSVVLLP